MRKLSIRLLSCLMIVTGIWAGTFLLDRQKLNKELVRLHVVANSDSEWDQNIKLQVRDAVLESLDAAMEDCLDAGQAKAYIRENVPKLETVANRALEALGVDQKAVVSFCREAFDVRNYDTFSLPSGIYDSLRITIGEGEGHNWWCVAFPRLCLPTTEEGFEEKAVGAGFSEPLTEALEGDCRLRFWVLDALGRLDAWVFGR